MKCRSLMLVLLISFATVAQETSVPTEPELSEKSELPDEEAEFPGGVSELKKFVQSEIRYPEKARVQRDQGRVYVQFTIEADGSLSNISVMESLTPELDAEAIRIISSMPKWKPAKLDGIPVRSFCRMPVTFTLVSRQSWREKRELRKKQK